eukprot:gene6914-11077_t
MNKTLILAVLLFTITLVSSSKQDPKIRLIQFSETRKLFMTEDSILRMLRNSTEEIHFIDITETPNLEKGQVPKTSEIPEKPKHQLLVKPLIKDFTVEEYKSIIDKLSSFYTRYYESDTGVQAAEWIFSYYTDIIKKLSNKRQELFKVEYFKHSWKQPSVICTIKGKTDEKVIIGSHLDSINGRTGRAPGADDDASGTAAVLQIFKAIANSKYKPKKTIEFHNYAAEEVGLRGSNAIAAKYKADQKKVLSMINLDMCGYNNGQDTIGVAMDYVEAKTTAFIKKLIPEYSNLKFAEIRCGYACSDHASWQRAGYRSGHYFEAAPLSNMNRNIHTARDLVDALDLKRALEFVKVGVGFAVELSADKN